MRQTGEVRDYLIDALIGLAEYRERYPRLGFFPITTRTFILEVPSGAEAEEEFQLFSADVQSIYMPVLYGLNASVDLAESNITFFHDYPFGPLRGEGTLIGIVDTGIEYTNPLFQYEDNTTRIVSIWDQSIEGNGVRNFPYGTEYSEADINEALKATDPYSIVPSRDEIGHGTFLAGVAAGDDRSIEAAYTGGAPEAMLVIVKLRPAKEYLREYYLIEDDAIAYQDNDYLAGIYYLIETARRLQKPIAICTGLGCNDGGHNGSTIVERYLNEASSYEDIVLVLSAGNEANQGHHYSNVIQQGGTQTFEVNVSEREKGFILRVWMNKPDIVAISFTTPLGQKIERIPINIGSSQNFKIPLEPSEITVIYTYPELGTGEQVISVRLATPTPGIWQFALYGENIVDGTYNVWLPREGFIRENTRFLKPEAFTTVCIPATAEEVIVVGAYNSTDKSIYAASGRGPTRTMTIKPDLIAPGVNVQGPNLSGGYTTATGTSIAAAITTSASALLLQWAVIERNLLKMNTRVAKTILIRGANRSPREVYPNNITGYGQLNLQSSIMQA